LEEVPEIKKDSKKIQPVKNGIHLNGSYRLSPMMTS